MLKFLHRILRATVMKHELGIVLIIQPTRGTLGAKVWGFKGAWYISPMHIYQGDLFTPTYTIDWYGEEYSFSGTLGFDAERVREAVCSKEASLEADNEAERH